MKKKILSEFKLFWYLLNWEKDKNYIKMNTWNKIKKSQRVKSNLF